MADRPNILVIVTDQLSHKALPMYGNAHSRTPALDRLAAGGTRFDRCYTCCPLCQPARAAFWTGRWPHETGVLSNGRKHPVPPVPETMPALGALFADAGYETVHAGKRHDAGSLRGFRCEPEGELPVEQEGPWAINYDSRRDAYTTAKVEEYLRAGPSSPFLLVADIQNPHDICSWIGLHQGPHEDEPVPGELPPPPENLVVEDFGNRPKSVQYICCAHNRQSQASGWNAENYRHYLAAYYHYVDLADRCVGRILDALQASGRADDTMVVFFADHGDSMGAHGLVTKHTHFYEETTRVPFLCAGKGVEGGNRLLADPLVSLQDLVPTLCDAAGIPAPEGLWGRSLMPWLQGRDDGSPHDYVASEWHTEWGFTVEPGRMIRTDRYKYNRFREEDGEELFDLQADPGETRTLHADPAHADALAEHCELLERYIAETGDDFHQLAAEAAPRWRRHAPGYHLHDGPAAPMVEG